MSRIGKMPITVPAGVTVTIEDNHVTVKGPKGELARQINKNMKLTMDNGVITVERPDDEKESRSLHGLSRTLINNMIIGVTQGFSKTLEINGVGYRAESCPTLLVGEYDDAEFHVGNQRELGNGTNQSAGVVHLFMPFNIGKEPAQPITTEIGIVGVF